MANKRRVEADLDSPNKRNTRFGSKTVETALRNSKRATGKRKRPAAKRKRAR